STPPASSTAGATWYSWSNKFHQRLLSGTRRVTDPSQPRDQSTGAHPALPGDSFTPRAPITLEETGIDPVILTDLALKTGYTVPHFTTEWAAKRLHLPLPLVQELLEQLRQDRLVEVLGQSGPFSYRFAVTQRGRERASSLLEVSGYIGPAPISLETYT